MTYHITVRTPTIMPIAVPRTLAMPGDPNWIPFAQRARAESAAMRKATGDTANYGTANNGGQTPRRRAWASQCPLVPFTSAEASVLWGMDKGMTTTRLSGMYAVGLLTRTARGVSPILWSRADVT